MVSAFRFRVPLVLRGFFCQAILAIVAPTDAANIRWNDMASGDFFHTAGNWAGGLVPGVLDVAQFGRSVGAFQFSYPVSFNNNATNQALHIEDDQVTFNLNSRVYTLTAANSMLIGNEPGSAFTGRLTVLGGRITSSTNIDVGAANAGALVVGTNGLVNGSFNLNVGKLGAGTLTVQTNGILSTTGRTTVGAGANGTANISGDFTVGSATLRTGQLNVGDTGNGTVNVELGGLLETSSFVSVGGFGLFAGAGMGTVNVRNLGSVWNSLGLLEIGDAGSGEVNVTLGGKLTSANVHIASSENGSGVVNVDGASSRWENSGDLNVGEVGTGVLNITNQGVVETEDGTIGGQNSGNGTANVTGADSRWTIADRLNIGTFGTGTLNITNGGAVHGGLISSIIVGSALNSKGTVNVSGANSLLECSRLILGSGGDAAVNITAGGTVRADLTTIGGAGTGAVTVDGAGSLLDVTGLLVGNLGGGMLSITGGGLVTSTSGSLGDFAPGHVTVNGAGSRWQINGPLSIGVTVQGTLQITAGSSVRCQSAVVGRNSFGTSIVTVDGAGSLWNTTGALTVGDKGDGRLEITAGGTVQSQDALMGVETGSTALITVEGAGSLWTNMGVLTVGERGAGTLNITDGGKVVTDKDASIGNFVNEPGTGTVTVSSAVAGADSVWEIGGRLAVGVDLIDFAPSIIDGGVGTLRIQPGGRVSVAEETYVSFGDLLSLEGGTLTAPQINFLQGGSSAANFQWTSGTLHVGTFQESLTNSAGVLAPGTSTGSTLIKGSYTQLTNGTLEIEIGPVGQSPQHDSVSVTGTATLDGQLDLKLIDGAAPLSSQTFVILSANTLVGAFDNIASGQRLNTSDGLGSFLVHYGAGSEFNPNQVVLSDFLAGIPGDFDHDGDVDGRDFLVWQRGNSPTPLSSGDLADWQANYGAGLLESANIAVPEPSALLLAIGLGIMFSAAHRK